MGRDPPVNTRGESPGSQVPYMDENGCYSVEEVRAQGNDAAKLRKMTPDQRVKYRDAVEKKLGSGYKRVKVCPDSGAIAFVAPRSFAPDVEVRESEASCQGVHYRHAGGGLIPNEGEKDVHSVDINGGSCKSTWQVANTTKPLASVIAMVKAGKRVVFDQHEGENISHILHKESGNCSCLLKRHEDAGRYDCRT